ncbi:MULTISPECIES: NADH-quinone oxidoreductase subunit NuoE [Cysteiniphilum]|uniref:NADH-quinone oxidoreductase subunit NuoE family protein n=1 Tax=Cysteiniphilum TaxID=2056696 RepID=UPI00177D7B9B|nr:MULTISPECIES: NADH-quinone oxidoreductase subunit NuoE [Cysteiniphilum]
MLENKLDKKEIFSPQVTELLENWEKRYPANQKRSVIIPGLHVLQDYNNGYLTEELMDKLALYLDVPAASVYEVATFYSMYDLKKVGRHKLNVCTNLSCMLNGAKKIMTHIENKLDIKAGQTTADGRITLKSVECQGACCGAPMLEVDKVFYENLTTAKVDQIIDSLE